MTIDSINREITESDYGFDGEKQMKKVKSVLSLTVLIMVISTICPAADSQKKAEPNWPTAQELLKKYTQTQDSIRAVIVKVETTDEATFTDPSGRQTYRKEYNTIDMKYDGFRLSRRSSEWGTNVNPLSPSNRDLKKENAFYRSDLWDGNDFYLYGRASEKYISNKYPATLSIAYGQKPVDNVTKQYLIGPHTTGWMGDERIDSLLSKTKNIKNISVRKMPERIGGSDCYVIDAQTIYGKIILWLDPEHGYNIAQVEGHKSGGDFGVSEKQIMQQGDSSSLYIKNVRFEKINNIWVPVEWDFSNSANYAIKILPTGRQISKGNKHFKITEIKINPEKEAFGPFVPDDVLDGSIVHVADSPKGNLTMGYWWRKGTVVDKSGKVIMDFTSKKQEK
jgi:hypothetical protein